MNNFITNIELKDKYIIITYQNTETRKIIYNELNRLKTLKQIKLEKDKLIQEKKYLKYVKLITLIITVSKLTIYLLTNFLINNTVFTIISSFLALEITLSNYLFCIYCNKKLNSINKLLNILETNQLPDEEEYLKKRKIINIEEYLKLKKQINIYNQYDYDYPRKINYQNDFKFQDNTHGKILEFKLKDEK